MQLVGYSILLVLCTTVSAVDVGDVTYYLYTVNNPNSPEIIYNNDASYLTNDSSRFDQFRKHVFIIHGWVDSYTAQVNQVIKAATFLNYDVNIFVFDWSPIAALSYDQAKAGVPILGKLLADFINDMMTTFGLNGQVFTLIGHSLGAHLAGNAGKHTFHQVDHILGLDPAGPGYDLDTTTRLGPSDADYVQIIHTAGVLPGIATPIGNVDYFPNGGLAQPNCGLDLLAGCSHARSFQYAGEAIAAARNFTAVLCPTFYHLGGIFCPNNQKSLMGKIIDIDKSIVGNYYLRTNGQSPFAQG